jgi:ABC-type uncharacterized transport system auxiliary subunit
MKKLIAIALLSVGLAGCASTQHLQPIVANPAPTAFRPVAHKKSVQVVKAKPVAKKQDKAPVAPAPVVSAPVAGPTPVVVTKLATPRWYDRFRARYMDKKDK